ncbi:MCE family protein [Aeromicrobium stalagmiti]|uniref:MCE family protein n=1 Tax=Aeromicrobium stalagmiti TaxID=2738988 RepID=UPI0015690E04|nr:MlaD family protein [Aeromicrobium stalagmiti]NRQ49675.1 MCE family protein [Aeromicrobium stalagmiti]
MITRLTKFQLVIFAIVTVIGGAFVGGRYAQLDRLVVDRSFPVTAQFSDSGGIFAGAQVTYRGIPVGKVGSLDFQQGGVQATIDIENSAPRIPRDVLAVVANKSAIGEQFIDLQPRANSGPYLTRGSEISILNTRIPIDTTTLLVDVNSLVKSVNTDSLRTVVDELGQAFEGTGKDLATILDTSSDFIQTADDNIDVTRSLIRDSDTVLQTQIDKQGELATFSKNLALLSDTLVDADPDLRRLLDKGSVSARTVRKVVDENSKDLSNAVRDLVTANKPLSKNVLGLQAVFVLYPYLLEGSFSVLDPAVENGKETGDYNATFGLVLTDPTATCSFAQNGGDASGYRQRRAEGTISDTEFSTDVDCKVKDNKIARQASKTVLQRSAAASGLAADGKDSWKWLLLDPAQ